MELNESTSSNNAFSARVHGSTFLWQVRCTTSLHRVQAMNIIEFIEKEVEDKCKEENNVFGYGIWSHHIVSVVKYAKLLAKEIGADIEVVEIASLLHDYGRISVRLEYITKFYE